MDVIRIENLEVYGFHGVFPEENRLGQNFYISASLFLDARRAGLSDVLEESVDYGAVCHFLADWMKSHTCKLIEAAAEMLAEECLCTFPKVRRLKLEVRKPQAPIGLPFGSVSVEIERGWHRVYLSAGSNMGDRKAYLEGAAKALETNRRIRLLKKSDYIVTEPYGGVEQEDFLNGCFCIDTLLTPLELLDELHSIEQAAGRERKVHWGPRTLDLDILLYDDLVCGDDRLAIPHPDMENRRFVLEPMAQIAPYLRHPVSHKTMMQLLAGLQGI